METHKFISHSAEHAVEQIQARLGPNAVVVDVRKLPRRVFRRARFEVTATVQEAAQPLTTLPPNFLVQSSGGFLTSLFQQSGLLPHFASKLASDAPAEIAARPVGGQIEHVRDVLKSTWRVVTPAAERVHIFVGAPGAGKSTVLCKWLAQHILAENRGAAVHQLDTHVANLSPQPRVYTEVLGAQFARTSGNILYADTLFIDLPGIELGDSKGLEATRKVIGEFLNPAVHLVLNGAYETSLLLEQSHFFTSLAPADIILSHLDEERRWGKFWNLIFGTQLGIRFLSLGQNVPGGLLPASAETLLSQEFGANRPVSRGSEAGKPSAKQPLEFAGR